MSFFLLSASFLSSAFCEREDREGMMLMCCNSDRTQTPHTALGSPFGVCASDAEVPPRLAVVRCVAHAEPHPGVCAALRIAYFCPFSIWTFVQTFSRLRASGPCGL